jgi:small subunit ribosomal protein S8
MRNSIHRKASKVEVPKTQLTKAIATILLKEGWIKGIDVTFLIRKQKDYILIQKIENYFLIRKRKVEKREHTKFNNQKKLFFPIGLKLKYYGKDKKSAITNLQCVSRPSLRIYVKRKEIPQILGGLGLIIVSTPLGLMTGREARHRKLGGEVLCSIWLSILEKNYLKPD